MSTAKPSTTRTILATAILSIFAVMACPNTPWDGGDPARELERMHARMVREQPAVGSTSESLNVFVRLASGKPAPGVMVRICDPARGSARDRVLYEGSTGDDGCLIATILLPATVSEFAVEWSGPHVANAAGQPPPESWEHVARTLVERAEFSTLYLSLGHP